MQKHIFLLYNKYYSSAPKKLISIQTVKLLLTSIYSLYFFYTERDFVYTAYQTMNNSISTAFLSYQVTQRPRKRR